MLLGNPFEANQNKQYSIGRILEPNSERETNITNLDLIWGEDDPFSLDP